MSVLIAIDPGVTSGVAVLREEDSTLIHSAQLGPRETTTWLRNMFRIDPQVGYLVHEQFRMYGGRVGASKSFSDLPEVQIIGAIVALAEAYSVQVASIPAGLYKSATAQWIPPKEVKGPHQKDAWRLGMWFQVVRQERPATITLKSGRTYRMFYNAEGHKEVTDG
jgi:hypothetical protein